MMQDQLDCSHSQRILSVVLVVGLIVCIVALASFGLVSPVHAATFTLNINIKDDNGQNITDAFVAVQSCGTPNIHCGFDPDGSIFRGNEIWTGYANAQGNIQFTGLQTNMEYWIVATKDFYACNTCDYTVYVDTPQTVNKNLVLDAPELSQVTDYGCTPLDLAT